MNMIKSARFVARSWFHYSNGEPFSNFLFSSFFKLFITNLLMARERRFSLFSLTAPIFHNERFQLKYFFSKKSQTLTLIQSDNPNPNQILKFLAFDWLYISVYRIDGTQTKTYQKFTFFPFFNTFFFLILSSSNTQ